MDTFTGSRQQRFLTPSHLVLIWILHEDTLLHYVGDNSIPSQCSHVSSHHRKHFSNKSMEKTTDTSFLNDDAQKTKLDTCVN